MDPDETARMRRFIWIHAGRKRTRGPVLDTILPEPDEWTDALVRWAVLDLLKEMNQSALAKLSPLPQSMISNIVNNKYHSSLSTDKLKAFGTWYQDYRISQKYIRQGGKGNFGLPRLTFHPDVEIPKLKAWYKEHPYPNEATLKSYVKELNQGTVRMERPEVSIVHLKNWWKNEKQKEKRTQKKNENNGVKRASGQRGVQEVSVSSGQSGCEKNVVKSKVRKTILGNHSRNRAGNQLKSSNSGMSEENLSSSVNRRSDIQYDSRGNGSRAHHQYFSISGHQLSSASMERGRHLQTNDWDPSY